MCARHRGLRLCGFILPFFGRSHVAYISSGVLGVSKPPRLVDMFAQPAPGPGAAHSPDRPLDMDTVGAEGVGVVIEAHTSAL